MPRAWRLAWVGVLAVGLGVVSAQETHLRGEIVRVGFAGSAQGDVDRGSDRYRVGYYTPVLVRFTKDGGDTFTGAIEVRQTDRDGDEVVARRDVMLTGSRLYYLYVPGGDDPNRWQFRVRALNADGSLAKLYNDKNELVPELTPDVPPAIIDNESRVILDITAVNRLGALTQERDVNRPVTVLRVAASELPDDPAGLEMADTIVWDEGDPEMLKDPGRQQALREWTRRGGRLVIAVSKNWQQLNDKFGDMLPAKLTKTESMSKVDPKWEQDLFNSFANPFEPPLTYCPVTQADLLPGALAFIPEDCTGTDPILAVRRPFGRGEVILVAAELRDLTDPKRRTNIQADLLLRRVVGVRREQQKSDQDNNFSVRDDLFRYVEQQTGFQVTTQLYLMFAFLFVVTYVALATGGSWVWLKKRKLIQHAWASFALVAVVASLTSLVAVQVIRGVGYKVQEMAFVDAEAGATDAAAVIYFGLKTPTHVTLDLRLATRGQSVEDTPDGTTSLRPLPVSTGPLRGRGSEFTAGQKYEVVSSLGEIKEVPLRATLKQFEALWHGRMPGRLEASLRRQRGDLRPDSWIRNGLGTDLKNCFLLVPTSASTWPDRQNIFGPRVYELGNLANGQQITLAQIEAAMAKAQGVKEGDKAKVEYLTDRQRGWVRGFGANIDSRWGGGMPEEERKLDMGRITDALMLVSTFDDINRDMRVQVARSQGQQLDRTMTMTRETALLIGFSDDAGPAVLCWRTPGSHPGRWRSLTSEEAGRRVVYRVNIPVEP